jgi:hypothetical protein
MSPEQTHGGLLDARTDVYALGVTLYELLTREVPFEANSTVELIGQILTQEPEPPSKRREAPLDRDLETICLTCLRKEPQRRYASAAELADDLGRYLAGDAIVARPTGVLEREWDALRQNRRASPVTIVMTIALVVVLVWAVRGVGRDAGYRLALAKLDARSPGSRVEAAKALRGYGAPALPHLIEAVRLDDDRRVRVEALGSLESLLAEHPISLRWSVPQLLKALEREGIDAAEQGLILARMRALSGRAGAPPPKGTDPAEWRSWWRGEADSLPPQAE